MVFVIVVVRILRVAPVQNTSLFDLDLLEFFAKLGQSLIAVVSTVVALLLSSIILIRNNLNFTNAQIVLVILFYELYSRK